MDDWTKLREISALAYRDGTDLLYNIETMEAGNKSEIVEPIRAALAGPTLKTIFLGLMTRVHLVTMRAFAPIRSDDRHMRVGIEMVRSGSVALPPYIVDAKFVEAVDLFD